MRLAALNGFNESEVADPVLRLFGHEHGGFTICIGLPPQNVTNMFRNPVVFWATPLFLKPYSQGIFAFKVATLANAVVGNQKLIPRKRKT